MTDDDGRYQLLFTRTARRALTDRLPEAVAAAAFEFIRGPLSGNPHPVGKRLLPPLADRHSARRGTYRVIYRIDDAEATLTIVDIDHRDAVYRPR